MFRNPVLTGFHPDPSILRVGADYFMTTSTFALFPGLPIYHSRDLQNWNLLGHALSRRSQMEMRTTDPNGGIYAPTLRHWKGTFYLTSCCLHKRGTPFGPNVSDVVRCRHVDCD